jgi:SAM-dependent methyltransferase
MARDVMTTNAQRQLAHFAHIDHDRRFRWQTEDAFVIAREHATILPLANALRAHRAVRGRPLRVLESGCGEGVNMIHLRQMGLSESNYVFEGVDVSAEAVAEGARHGMHVQVGDGLRLPYADASYDAVYTRDVLHHLGSDSERRQFIAEMRRVAGPQGVVVIVEPNPWNPMIFAFAWAVRAERGILTGTESRLRKLLPHARVTRVTPSAAWRGWVHYRSPFMSWSVASRVAKACLHAWEAMCRYLPTHFWAWRVYVWDGARVDT